VAGPVTPMLALAGTAYANNAYNASFAPSSLIDVKPLLFGGIAAVLLELFAAVPGMAPVATGIGWVALIGYLLAGGAGAGTPAGNLSKITGGK
jgi:hypothetical protein